MKTLKGTKYEFDTGKFEGGYWNANGFAVAVVASIGQVDDWCAYIGGADPKSEEEGLRFVASHGAKLSEEDARHFFPDLELQYCN